MLALTQGTFTMTDGTHRHNRQLPRKTKRQLKTSKSSLYNCSTEMSLTKTRIHNERLLGDKYKSPYVLAKEQSENFKRERGEFRRMRSDLLKDVI